MKGYKGFDKDLKCRDMQYEIGKDYEINKKPIRCGDIAGWHGNGCDRGVSGESV